MNEILERYRREPQDLAVQDSVVQRFVYTYELACKTLKRYLEATSSSPAEINLMSFQELIKTGNEKGLLRGNAAAWLNYRNMCNITSYPYNSDKAKDVIAAAPSLREEAGFMMERIMERQWRKI